MSLVLSTSWNAFRHTDGLSLINEIKALGFEEVELSFNLTAPMVETIGQQVRQRSISVASVHNFCPIPEGVQREAALPDYYSMSSLDEGQRIEALKYARATIDTAAMLGAKAVVLHCGRVEIPDRTVDLIALYSKGRKKDRVFLHLREDIIRERAEKRMPFLQNTLKSLQELNAYASGKNVMLGVETRYYYREIPFLDEVGIILDRFKDSNIFYWHDTGHAQLAENLGFIIRHEDYLDRYSSRMIGIHLHDISGCSDHQPPGTGEFDFNRIKPYINKDTIKVIEAHHPAIGAQLIKGKELLQGLFNG